MQVVFKFANFYPRFLKALNKLLALFTSMFKTKMINIASIVNKMTRGKNNGKKVETKLGDENKLSTPSR